MKKFKILCVILLLFDEYEGKHNNKPKKFKAYKLLLLMVEFQQSGDPFLSDMIVRFRDLEEKQKMLKDRILLIGQNLIETKEKTSSDILEIKKELEIIKKNTSRLVSFLETASAEFSKFARKEDLEILSRQAKMFQPLEFVRKKDLKKSKV